MNWNPKGLSSVEFSENLALKTDAITVKISRNIRIIKGIREMAVSDQFFLSMDDNVTGAAEGGQDWSDHLKRTSI